MFQDYLRPWDSEEDVHQPVVLSGSGCASGCASDHLPHARSTMTLLRSMPSLQGVGSGTLRYSNPIRPGYTQTSTMPHIRSVSGKDVHKIKGGYEEIYLTHQISITRSDNFLWRGCTS